MNPQIEPPRLLDKLIKWLIAPHLCEEVLGDVHERYALRAKRLGPNKARQRYWRDVLTYVRWSKTKVNHPASRFLSCNLHLQSHYVT